MESKLVLSKLLILKNCLEKFNILKLIILFFGLNLYANEGFLCRKFNNLSKINLISNENEFLNNLDVFFIKSNKIITKTIINAQINNFFSKNNHRYSLHKKCQDNKIWIATSRFPILNKKNSIPYKIIGQYCRKILIYFADISNAKYIIKLGFKNYFKDYKIKKSGFITITCLPNDINKGFETIYFYPNNVNYSHIKIPGEKNINNNKIIKKNIFMWINYIREKSNINKLIYFNFLDIKIINKDIYHDRLQIKKISNYLGKKFLIFIGENKVKAANIYEMIKLIWISPRHRSLILSDSKYIDMKLTKIKNEYLLTMYFAKPVAF